MNRNPEHVQRSPADFILFALTFFGFVLGAGGVITSSVPVSVIGFVMMLICLVGFMLKGAF